MALPSRPWFGANLIGLAVVAAGFLAIAYPLSTHRVTDFMIFCIFALSFDLLYGYMGRLSFGHLLYLGTGAYCTGLFIKYIDQGPFLACLVGIAAAALLGLILGLIIVRTTGACFALINLAFNSIGFFLVLSPLRAVTNGEDGFGVRAAKAWFFNPGSKTHMYFLVLACLLAVLFLLKKMTTSPGGILVRSIKENEERARFLGYNTYIFKWLTFINAAGLAGLAGALHALNYKYVNPNVMDAHANVGVVFACLIGGAGKLYGALLGGVVYMIISNFLPIYIQRWEMFLGIILLIIVFRFDKGIWGYVETGWAYLKRRYVNREGLEETTEP